MCASAPGHEHRGGTRGRGGAERRGRRKRRRREGGGGGEGEDEEAERGGEISTRAGLTNDASLHMPRLTLQIRVRASYVAVYDAREKEEE